MKVILDCVGGSYFKQNMNCIADDGQLTIYGLMGKMPLCHYMNCIADDGQLTIYGLMGKVPLCHYMNCIALSR